MSAFFGGQPSSPTQTWRLSESLGCLRQSYFPGEMEEANKPPNRNTMEIKTDRDVYSPGDLVKGEVLIPVPTVWPFHAI